MENPKDAAAQVSPADIRRVSRSLSSRRKKTVVTKIYQRQSEAEEAEEERRHTVQLSAQDLAQEVAQVAEEVRPPCPAASGDIIKPGAKKEDKMLESDTALQDAASQQFLKALEVRSNAARQRLGRQKLEAINEEPVEEMNGKPNNLQAEVEKPSSQNAAADVLPNKMNDSTAAALSECHKLCDDLLLDNLLAGVEKPSSENAANVVLPNTLVSTPTNTWQGVPYAAELRGNDSTAAALGESHKLCDGLFRLHSARSEKIDLSSMLADGGASWILMQRAQEKMILSTLDKILEDRGRTILSMAKELERAKGEAAAAQQRAKEQETLGVHTAAALARAVEQGSGAEIGEKGDLGGDRGDLGAYTGILCEFIYMGQPS